VAGGVCQAASGGAARRALRSRIIRR
jgi:hypothetical protein